MAHYIAAKGLIMLKKSLVAIAAAAAVALPAAAASAQPPQEVVFDDFIVLFPDPTLNKSVFINISAREFCDWLDTGPSGPPPARDEVTGRETVTGKGAVVGKIDAEDLYIEMWNLGEEGPQEGPCEDIQDQLEDGAEPWATGTAAVKAKDNDIFGSGTRANAFGERITAQLTDGDGNEYSYRSIFRLNDRCTAPEFGPPSCLVDKSKLKML